MQILRLILFVIHFIWRYSISNKYIYLKSELVSFIQLAAEYELLILSVGKDRLHDECLVVRKRGTLQQKQELELEERKEKQRQKQLREKEEAKETVDKKEEIKIGNFILFYVT